MRPVIKPALRRLRRGDSTVQIGVGPERAIVLSGPAADRVLESMDGTRDRAGVLAAARDAGVAEETAARVLDLLADRGVLDDAATDTGPMRGIPLEERDRLQPDLGSVSLVSGAADAGLTALRRRRRAAVHVHGVGRVGACVASLLAAAGVGRVHPVDAGLARPADVCPGGLAPAGPGTRRDTAATVALRRASPTVRTDAGPGPDLAVLSPVGDADPEPPDALLRERVPHLVAGIRETCGVVGPLVLPGSSSCLRCRHLHRADRDPAWPRVAAQLPGRDRSPGAGAAACDASLAAAVAAFAAGQVLAYLDGASEPLPTLSGQLELAWPEWQWRRRSWPPHPRCGCGWDAREENEPAQ